MIIGVLGSTDKRPVIYGLMKLLSMTGEIIVITNNRQYRRLLEDKASAGHMANIMIVVTDATPDEVFHEIGYTQQDFDHIIFDLHDAIPEEVDKLYYVKGYEMEDEDVNLLECLEEYTMINMLYDGQSVKGAINVPPLMELFGTVEMIESKRLLLSIPSKALNLGLAKDLSPFLKIPQKDIFKLLTKGWKK